MSGATSVTVSVVVPVHDEQEHLPGCFEQLDRLTFDDLEIVFVDDGSTDGSRAMILDYARGRPHVRCLTHPVARGVAQARNSALAEVRGTYVWMTDCDDVWSPDIVTRLVDRAERSGADVVLCDALRVVGETGSEHRIADCSGRQLDGADLLEEVLEGRVQGHLWNKLFRRDVLVADLFPPTRAHSDLGGVLRVAVRTRTVAQVPEVLYTYRVRAGSVLNSRGYRWEDLTDCLEIAREAAARTARGRSSSALDVFAVRSVYVPLANEVFRRNGPSSVLAGVRRAILRDVGVLGLVRVVGRAGPAPALKATAVCVAPWLYRALYGRHRARRWGRADGVRVASPGTAT